MEQKHIAQVARAAYVNAAMIAAYTNAAKRSLPKCEATLAGAEAVMTALGKPMSPRHSTDMLNFLREHEDFLDDQEVIRVLMFSEETAAWACSAIDSAPEAALVEFAAACNRIRSVKASDEARWGAEEKAANASTNDEHYNEEDKDCSNTYIAMSEIPNEYRDEY